MDKETLEGNNLMKDVILYLQKNLAIVYAYGAQQEREEDY